MTEPYTAKDIYRVLRYEIKERSLCKSHELIFFFLVKSFEDIVEFTVKQGQDNYAKIVVNMIRVNKDFLLFEMVL